MRSTQFLTDGILKRTAAPRRGRLEMPDARCQGLTFRITDKDARTFSFRFRCPKSGRPQRYTIGAYPDISLAEARKRADALRVQVAQGINPVEQRRRERETRANKSFGAVSARYLSEYSQRHNSPSYARDNARNLAKHVLPHWRYRNIETITRADVVELVERIVSGAPIMANRVQSLISTVFTFAVDAGIVDRNPCARLRKRGAEQAATRVLSDDEIRQLWNLSPLPPVSRLSGLALRLILLTGCRPGEVAGMRRSELENFSNPAGALWIIPGARTKNKRTHAVPLARASRAIIADALEMNDPATDYVFPSRSKGGGSLRPHSLTVAMRRMTAKTKGPGSTTWQAAPPTPHDLRRTVATRLSALGTSRDDVGAILNHVRRDITGRVYDQYDRLTEKRIALGAWDRALAAIVKGRSK